MVDSITSRIFFAILDDDDEDENALSTYRKLSTLIRTEFELSLGKFEN